MGSSFLELPARSLRNLQRHPIRSLRNRAAAYVRGAQTWSWQKVQRIPYTWPVYDAWRYVRNREAVRFYRGEIPNMLDGPVQRRIVSELRAKGISIVSCDDLFPPTVFKELQEIAEKRLLADANQVRIQDIKSGAKPMDKAGKYYLVRMHGQPPIFDLSDPFLRFSLSAEVLSVVCRYLGMLARLGFMDLWFNVPTPGPPKFSQCWHRDPDDRRLVKLFLYLRDVADSGGPFCYVSETHNDGRFGNFRRQVIHSSNYPGDHVIENGFPEVARIKCTGKAGTLVFCDTSGFHKGGDPTQAGRLLFTAAYTSNAGVPVVTDETYYGVRDARSFRGSLAAQYALGHLDAD
jgi:hypothetical protein